MITSKTQSASLRAMAGSFLLFAALLILAMAGVSSNAQAGQYFRTASSRVQRMVERGDLPALKALAEKGFDLNENAENYLTAAISANQLDVLRFLVERGLDPKLTINSSYDSNLLTHLCSVLLTSEGEAREADEEETVGIAQFLLEQGVDPRPVKSETTLLHLAAEAGNAKLAEFLIGLKFDLDATDDDENTPLMVAVRNENVRTVKVLLKAGAKTVILEDGVVIDAMLHDAIQSANLELVQALVEGGAPLETFFNGGTALHAAVAGKEAEITRFLVEKGADLEARTEDGWTPLLLAILDDLDVVKFLADHGANLTAVTDNDRDALFLSAEAGKPEIVDFFLEKKLDPKRINFSGQSLLFAAALSGNPDLFRKLTALELDLKVVDCWGQTLLFAAAAGGNLEILKFLSENGVEINARNLNGRTAFNVAKEGNAGDEVIAFFRSLGGRTTSNRIRDGIDTPFTNGMGGMGGMGCMGAPAMPVMGGMGGGMGGFM